MTKREVYLAAGLALVFAIVMAPLGEVGLHFLTWVAAYVAKASTLGVHFLVDAQYAAAAKSLGEPTGLASALALIMSMICLMGCTLLSAAWRVIRHTTPAAKRVGLYPAVARAGLLPLLIFAMLFVILAAQANYTEQLSRDYLRIELLSAPYLSAEEIRMARAEFVLVKTKEQYDGLMARLTAVIKQHNGRLQ